MAHTFEGKKMELYEDGRCWTCLRASTIHLQILAVFAFPMDMDTPHSPLTSSGSSGPCQYEMKANKNTLVQHHGRFIVFFFRRGGGGLGTTIDMYT